MHSQLRHIRLYTKQIEIDGKKGKIRFYGMRMKFIITEIILIRWKVHFGRRLGCDGRLSTTFMSCKFTQTSNYIETI